MVTQGNVSLLATLDEKFAAIGKSLAWKRFCKAVLNHPDLAKAMVREIGNLIHNECVSLVSSNDLSTLRKKSKSELSAFKWTDIASEWEMWAPTFLMLLAAAGDKQWHRKESITPKCIPALCMAGAVLMKTRNKHVSKVQCVISLVLNAGNIS